MTPAGHEDSGVSGTIGTVFLIIVVTAGMGVLMVAILSQPQPEKVPAMTAEVIDTSSALFLKHDGGDTLRQGEYKILVDGQDRTAAFGNPATWSVGEMLQYSGFDPSNLPNTIQIVYTGGKSGQTIEQIWVKTPTLVTTSTTTTITTTPTSTATTTTTTTTTTITATQTATATATTTATPTATATATATVTTTATPTATTTTVAPSSYTLLNAQRKGQLVSGGYMQFKVTGSYSTVTINGTQYSLSAGDTVKLLTGNNGYGQISASTSQISTFSFNQVTLYINGVQKDYGKVTSIWISGYDSYQSTLTIEVSRQPSGWTQLVYNGNTVIYGTNAAHIYVYNIGTACGNSMVLDAESNNVYYSGCATGYSVA